MGGTGEDLENGGFVQLWLEGMPNGLFRRWKILVRVASCAPSFTVPLTAQARGEASTSYNTPDSWRLLPPAPVGYYTEDCVFRTALIVTQASDPEAGTLHKDDAFYTKYVKTQIQSRDWSWTNYGERNYNFGPGAPVRIFLL
jgi:hypothetical protein